MAVRAYAGAARPVNDRYEGKAGYEVVEWDDLGGDGTIYRGYRETGTGALLSGAAIEISVARLAVLATETAARADREAQIATFVQSVKDLAQLVKDNAATAAQQRQLLVKLSRAVVGLLSDLP
jgi:hypothetical protein